jgi:hypothetical protein
MEQDYEQIALRSTSSPISQLMINCVCTSAVDDKLCVHIRHLVTLILIGTTFISVNHRRRRHPGQDGKKEQ